MARKCLDLAPAFGHDRRVIMMSAVKVELPPELAPLTARFTLDLPDADELKSVVKRVVAECARAAGVDGPVTGRSRPAGGPAARLHHVRDRARDPVARLYDKYIGETEKNLDKALRMAEQMAPCVLMIDELEKGLSYNQRRRAQGDLRGPSTQAEARPEALRPRRPLHRLLARRPSARRASGRAIAR